ncbi:MAG: hypothetical protein methR_P1689 [Methyloprofundus sp.]|nr:MAG: hypothetical protein methR_P1689 [Methyloprofundus sp.]
MNKNILGLAVVAALTTGTANAATIDTFDDAAMSVAADGTATVAALVAGGFRTVDMVKTGPLGATASVLTPPGIYSHSADALTSAISTITWDANGAGLGGLDWVEGLINNTFDIDILSTDLAGAITLTLLATDTFGGSDSVTTPSTGAGILNIAFSSFSGVDFTSMDFLSLQVNGITAADITLDSLVPYPLNN